MTEVPYAEHVFTNSSDVCEKCGLAADVIRLMELECVVVTEIEWADPTSPSPGP